MKKFCKTPEETKTSKDAKTTETAEKNEKKITEDDLDSVELNAIHRLAFHMAMRRRLKDLIEGEKGKEPPRGILSELEKDSDPKPSRTMHSVLDEMDNPWDELFGKHHSDDDDEDEPPFGDPDDDEDDDEDDDDEESATNQFLHEHYIPNNHGKYVPRPRAKCADGYSVSIQAGSGSGVRCWPNEDTDEFTHVALDFPSCVDEELLPYRFDLEDDDEIFYFFVPVEVVDRVLEKHGGIVGTESRGEYLVKKMFGI